MIVVFLKVVQVILDPLNEMGRNISLFAYGTLLHLLRSFLNSGNFGIDKRLGSCSLSEVLVMEDENRGVRPENDVHVFERSLCRLGIDQPYDGKVAVKEACKHYRLD